MSTTGEIRTLYSDREQTQAVFPRTKVKAVSDDNGVGLDAILDSVLHIGEAAGEAATVPLNADTLGGKLPSDYAPAGFGLGETNVQTLTDLNDMNIPSGLYEVDIPTANKPYRVTYARAQIFKHYENVVQILHELLSGLIVIRTNVGGRLGEWEYVNPPMIPGEEYRTTERFDGKVVYARMLNCGAIATDGELNHSLRFTRLVSFSAECNGTSDNAFDKSSGYYFHAWANKYYVWFEAGSSMVTEGGNVYATLKYIKD